MRLHKREAVEEQEVVVDTTVQEKNINYFHRHKTLQQGIRAVFGDSKDRGYRASQELCTYDKEVDICTAGDEVTPGVIRRQ